MTAPQTIPKKVLLAIEARLRSGQSTVITEAKKLGHSNRIALRTALKATLGPKQYVALVVASRRRPPAKPKAKAKPRQVAARRRSAAPRR